MEKMIHKQNFPVSGDWFCCFVGWQQRQYYLANCVHRYSVVSVLVFILHHCWELLQTCYS